MIISHSHWDHAGGVLDFPEAQVSVPALEMDVIRRPTTGAGGTWASQIAAKSINWKIIEFKAIPYKGYATSLDLYQDGKIVLVPMPGHTPGSIGLFLTTDSGKCYFFIGDISWKVDALRVGAPKFWAASLIVDRDAKETQFSADKVRQLMQQEPNLVVVPAHDGQVQDALGYFPAWVQ